MVDDLDDVRTDLVAVRVEVVLSQQDLESVCRLSLRAVGGSHHPLIVDDGAAAPGPVTVGVYQSHLPGVLVDLRLLTADDARDSVGDAAAAFAGRPSCALGGGTRRGGSGGGDAIPRHGDHAIEARVRDTEVGLEDDLEDVAGDGSHRLTAAVLDVVDLEEVVATAAVELDAHRITFDSDVLVLGAADDPFLFEVVVVVGRVVGGGEVVDARLEDVGCSLGLRRQRLRLRLGQGSAQQETGDGDEKHGAVRCGAGSGWAAFIPRSPNWTRCLLSKTQC